MLNSQVEGIAWPIKFSEEYVYELYAVHKYIFFVDAYT